MMKRKRKSVVHVTPQTAVPVVLGAPTAGVVAMVTAETLEAWPKCRRPNCHQPIDPRFAQGFEYVCTRCAISENAETCKAYYEEKKRATYARLVASGLVAVRVNHHSQENEETNGRDMEQNAGSISADRT